MTNLSFSFIIKTEILIPVLKLIKISSTTPLNAEWPTKKTDDKSNKKSD